MNREERRQRERQRKRAWARTGMSKPARRELAELSRNLSDAQLGEALEYSQEFRKNLDQVRPKAA